MSNRGPGIAVVGMACRYADARSPQELWQNLLAQRSAFRRIPAERLRLEDHFSTDPLAPDTTYLQEAAVLSGYEFDRVRFRVSGDAFRVTDMAHWLALDVATQALEDAGLLDDDRLPRRSTGVLVGNSLTGELSRANLLRLRWPYVRRVVAAALRDEGWSEERSIEFLAGLEQRYKAPFPVPNEESLAGGLSNTIAGRIANHHDLQGGGYTVDGACASSLLAVANGCSALAAGELDLVLAGGVDISLDPFELVGFARTGALAAGEMRVYDRHSSGFIPGEGCGFVVLMRLDEALDHGLRVHAVLRGWGISSDGSGGLTRPEAEGQLLAVTRAYRRAGFGIDTVPLFAGHGTGTEVGDATELTVLDQARRSAGSPAVQAAIGSVKANIGHTKAAAGVAGLITAVLAVDGRIIPPTGLCSEPHPVLRDPGCTLRPVRRPEPWPAEQPLRAGVSAMGFGGINAHVVVEGIESERPGFAVASYEASWQDAELLLLEAGDRSGLLTQVTGLQRLAAGLSRAEVGDLGAELARSLMARESVAVRAAVVASNPAQLALSLGRLASWLATDVPPEGRPDAASGVLLGPVDIPQPPRVGLLFPGQGSPANLDGGAWRRRFPWVDALLLPLPADQAIGQTLGTEVAQPAIISMSLVALRLLQRLGIEATVAVGHSIGELSALHWAGCLGEQELIELARVRGQAMADAPGEGAMAAIGADQDAVAALLAELDLEPGEQLVIAGVNTPRQTVVSGTRPAVQRAWEAAASRGWQAVSLPVSHAFHSPLMVPAGETLAEALAATTLSPPRRSVCSTITGAELSANDDLRALLCRQLTDPVLFADALRLAAGRADLLVEVGPGTVLSGITRELVTAPVLALDAGGPSLAPMLRAIGALWVLGAELRIEQLFSDRFTRPYDLHNAEHPGFLTNPCEEVPVLDDAGRGAANAVVAPPARTTVQPAREPSRSVLGVVRELVARRAELPLHAVSPDCRLLADLHLSSIVVSQLVAEASGLLDLPIPAAATDFAGASVGQVVQALEELQATGEGLAARQRSPDGVDSWVRAFTVTEVERSLSGAPPPPARQAGRLPHNAGGESRIGSAVVSTLRGGTGGTVLCLAPGQIEEHPIRLLAAARAALASPDGTPFVLVQEGPGLMGKGLARCLHLESPSHPVVVIELPVDAGLDPDCWAQIVAAEMAGSTGFREVRYGSDGRRLVPVLRPLPGSSGTDGIGLGPEDLLLVTGGGKGITAECALALVRRSGARLAVLGRSDPESDPELWANLQRLSVASAAVRYQVADLSVAASVRTALEQVQAELGPVTAILHGAGHNRPQLLGDLTESAFRETTAVKLAGLQSILAPVDPEQLRLLVAFGSIIARTGMRGEADYAEANEQLRLELERFAAEYEHCRCLCIEWSVWSGVGMGDRLGRIAALNREGITAITPDRGVQMLEELLLRLWQPGCDEPVAVVVSGRFGDPPTLEVERPQLPLLRFLERPRLHLPGIELVADSELSESNDPYLADHVVSGQRLLPAVLALEAMTQVIGAVTGDQRLPVLRDLHFERPLIVPAGQEITVRVASLVRRSGDIEVVIRCSETGFAADHCRATVTVDPCEPVTVPLPDEPLLDLDPERDLYGPVLFQRGRFARIRGYRHLSATECRAEIAGDDAQWFGPFLPSQLRLGDPGIRDAALHCIQACIPHATVLPVAVERIVPGVLQGPCTVTARERSRHGRSLLWELEIRDADGGLVESWQGLELRIVEQLQGPPELAPPLLGPYLERCLDEVLPDAELQVLVERGEEGADRRGRSERAMRRLLGSDTELRWRPDGMPEISGERTVSVSHSDDLVLVVAGLGRVGCDLERIAERPWQQLLGEDRWSLAKLIAEQAGEPGDTAATRVWCCVESLVKAGNMKDTPLLLDSVRDDGWVVLTAGAMRCATVVLQDRVVGVMAGRNEGRG